MNPLSPFSSPGAIEEGVTDGFAWAVCPGGGVEITRYTGFETALTIPAQLEGRPVLRIGERAFYGSTLLTGVTLPQGVTSIGESAFAFCVSLSRITLPQGLVSIGKSAFRLCTDLGRLDLPQGLRAIESEAFCGCAGLTEVALPEGLTLLGSRALAECRRLSRVSLPLSLTDLDANPFPGSPVRIACPPRHPAFAVLDGVLFHMPTRTLVSFPSGWMGDYTVPDGIRSIRPLAFSGCNGLTGLTLPRGFGRIDRLAFTGCTGLTRITLSDEEA